MTIEERLRSAADDLDDALDVTLPPFEPRSSGVPRFVAAGVAVAVVVGGLVALRPEAEPVETIVTTPEVADSVGTDSVDPGPVLDGLVRGFDPVPVSPMDDPDAEGALEPDFGTTVRRLTDAAPGTVITPVFSGTQTFNVDGSQMLLYRSSDSSSHVVVGRSGSIRDIEIEPVDIEDVNWDATDPDVLHWPRRDSNEMVSTNVATGVDTVVAVEACDQLTMGTGSGSTSSGTPIIGLLCSVDGATQMLAFDTRTGTATLGPEAESAPISLPGGGFVLVGPDTVEVFDDDFSPVARHEFEASTFTVASDGSGRDVLVATVFSGEAIGTAVALDLRDGSTEVIAGPATGFEFPPSGSSLSTPALDRPALLAGVTQPDAGAPADALANEVFLVDVESGIAYRLAHHRMSDQDAFSAWPTSTAVSPTGDVVLFSSDWGGDSVDTYLVDLG